ncbi:MAG: endolytic transglycosylase MltG [Candidatus Saccharimonadaceae bacterium]|nr:endolytic transglycosylase MltG [Candidatus Saccharimonadaceae bacterium]
MAEVPAETNKIPLQPIESVPSGLKKVDNCSKRKKIFVWALIVIFSLVIIPLVGGIIWYNIQLAPVSVGIANYKKVTIAPGSTSGQIGEQLKKQALIKNSLVFDMYSRLAKKNNLLRAGTYRLSPTETTPQIVQHLVEGSSLDTFDITFYYGATLVDNTDNKNKYDVTTVLSKAGYTDEEITSAFKADYSSPLFADKPISADIEGYVYGDTYNFNSGVSVGEILQKTFDEFYSVIQKNNLIEGFARHNLNLYQGITLASIVQREASNPDDQKKVAQVFYSRLSMGMSLGSDVTYQYIADKTGIARDPMLDSPYNTRRYTGLPPGPISSPGLTALLAVADPADTDYLFFLAGDDGITYFAHTEAEHEANIINHCQINCSTP